MFDWLKKNANPSNIVPFPEPKIVPEKEEYIQPKKPSQTHYRLGLTDDNRVSFLMGYTEITMNATGVDQLIAQLEFFRDQLWEEK